MKEVATKDTTKALFGWSLDELSTALIVPNLAHHKRTGGKVRRGNVPPTERAKSTFRPEQPHVFTWCAEGIAKSIFGHGPHLLSSETSEAKLRPETVSRMHMVRKGQGEVKLRPSTLGFTLRSHIYSHAAQRAYGSQAPAVALTFFS